VRAKEFISESPKYKKMRNSAVNAIPGMTTYPELSNNNNPYLAYRFGVALALSPDGDMCRETNTGSNFTMIDYSDADLHIRRHAEKIMGVKSKQQTPAGSCEADSVNSTSPVKAFKGYKKK
jgi:hypothetical protein